jgi:hypothetical protein
MPGPTPRVDRDEFARLNAEGATIPVLAEHFRITPTYVSRLRTKMGIKSPNVLNLTPERLAAIEAMLDDGMPFKEIKRTAGVDMETLRKHFPGRGWTIEQANEHRRVIRELNPLIRRNNLVDSYK